MDQQQQQQLKDNDDIINRLVEQTRSSIRSSNGGRIFTSNKKPNSNTVFKEEQIKSYTDANGILYNVGEHVYMDTNKANQPFAIGSIIDFKTTRKDYYYIEIQWYYRPNEIPDGIYIPLMQDRYIENKNVSPSDLAICSNPIIKSRELFASECRDIYPASYIKGKCKVYHYQDILEANKEFNPYPDTFFCTLTYNPEARRLANTQGEIRVGASHQAKLPTCLTNLQPNDMPEKCDSYEQSKWKCSKINDQDLLTYLQAARSIAAFVGMCDRGNTEDMYDAVQRDDTTINALNILHDNNYDSGQALQTLVKCPIPKGIESKWNEDDQKKFVKGLRQWGKNFHRIRRDLLPHKSTSDLVEFYYLWKKTPAAQNSKPRKRIRPPSTIKKSTKKQANSNLVNTNNLSTPLSTTTSTTINSNTTNLAVGSNNNNNNHNMISTNNNNNNNVNTTITTTTTSSTSSANNNNNTINNEHFSGSEQMDSDQESDDSDNKQAVLCCKHCSTTSSKDWQNGGHDNLLLCYDCRMYYKKYGELPRISPITPTIVTQPPPSDENCTFKPINDNPSPVESNETTIKTEKIDDKGTQNDGIENMAIDLSISNNNIKQSNDESLIKTEDEPVKENRSPLKTEASDELEGVREKKIKLDSRPSSNPSIETHKTQIESKQDLNISTTSTKTSSRSCTPATNQLTAQMMSPQTQLNQLPFFQQPPHFPPFGFPGHPSAFNPAATAFNQFCKQPDDLEAFKNQQQIPPGAFPHLFPGFPPFPPPEFMLGNFRPPGIPSPAAKAKLDDDGELTEYVDDPPPQPINVLVHKSSELKKPESNAMFVRVWDRGANSCARSDLTFKYLPNSAYLKAKAERKQKQQQLEEQKAKEEKKDSRLNSPFTSGFQPPQSNKLKTSSSLAEMQKLSDSFGGVFDATSRAFSPRNHSQSPLIKDGLPHVPPSFDSTPALRQLRDIADRSNSLPGQLQPGFPRLPNLDPQSQHQLFSQLAYLSAMERNHHMPPPPSVSNNHPQATPPGFLPNLGDPHLPSSMRNPLLPPNIPGLGTPGTPSHLNLPGFPPNFPGASAMQEFLAAREREIAAQTQQILRRQPNLNPLEATAAALAQFTKKEELSRIAVLERERALHANQEDLRRFSVGGVFDRDRQMQLLANNFNHEDMFR